MVDYPWANVKRLDMPGPAREPKPKPKPKPRPRPRDQWTTIQDYFERDNERRFQLEGLHGKGGQGCVYKVKYTPVAENAVSRFLVVKIADPSTATKFDVNLVWKEKRFMETYRGCKHVVRLSLGPDDPLAPAKDELGWAWLYMENLENGTLFDFQYKMEQRSSPLENALLWLLFLCAIRGCIALEYPWDNRDENETMRRSLPQPTGLVHADLHCGNVMFGSWLDDPEHDILPVMKILDFGLSYIQPSGGLETGMQRNQEDVGILMAGVITGEYYSKYVSAEIEIDISKFGGATNVLAPAARLLGDAEMGDSDPYPYLKCAETEQYCGTNPK
ncbi:hypothetical protein F4677DRAFT_445671 [Hypoxylon crocopeplum]|nr:hypothetical protein F4677DRAFT_445671 [Hypoxylon crocopeplum]